MDERMTIAEALRRLDEGDDPENTVLFSHGSLAVEIYRPSVPRHRY